MKTLVEEIKQIMIPHGQTDLSKLLLEVMIFGDKVIKITTFWLVMFKLHINQAENQLQSRWLQDLIQSMKKLL